MERRGRIPVATFRTQEGKTRSRSRVREPDYNDQDPETDLFTLLEDNIALKEENKALKLEIEDHKKIQNELLEDNAKMHEELDALKKQHRELEEQVKTITTKLTRANTERNALDRLHKMKIEQIEDLHKELDHLRRGKSDDVPTVVIASTALKNKLIKMLPSLANTEMESLMDVESTAGMPITSDLMERLVDEFTTVKNATNSVELQLYEANEKMAELLENQHHLEEENVTLRNENTNLTKVAKLLTDNMKESVETSKKMEAALIKLKQRNDELTMKMRDATDGEPGPSPSPTTIKANEEFNQIQEEIHNQTRDHGERIVEMKTLMEAAIQKNTNDELKTLQVKLEIMEEELRKAIARAESAENELEKYKNVELNMDNNTMKIISTQKPPPPPPPPPPMPEKLLYQSLSSTVSSTFSDSIALHNFHKGGSSGDKIIDTVKQQVQAEAATGLDALVREFKSGRVTLRRNRRKTRTNEALQEMFQVLEISTQQNRNSKICINMHI